MDDIFPLILDTKILMLLAKKYYKRYRKNFIYNIDEVEFQTWMKMVKANYFQDFAQLEYCTYIDLRENLNLHGSDLCWFFNCKHFYCNTRIEDKYLYYLRKCNTFRLCTVTTRGAKYLKNCTSLTINGTNQLRNEGLKYLKNCTYLNVYHPTFQLEALKYLPKCKTAIFTFDRFKGEELKYLENFERVQLSGTSMFSDDLKYLKNVSHIVIRNGWKLNTKDLSFLKNCKSLSVGGKKLILT